MDRIYDEIVDEYYDNAPVVDTNVESDEVYEHGS